MDDKLKALAEYISAALSGAVLSSEIRHGELICRIERGTRVTIAFGEAVSYAVKPKLMMTIEQRLRRKTGDPLELFMQDMKDANKIRRL